MIVIGYDVSSNDLIRYDVIRYDMISMA